MSLTQVFLITHSPGSYGTLSICSNHKKYLLEGNPNSLTLPVQHVELLAIVLVDICMNTIILICFIGDDEGGVADFKIAASLGGQFAKRQVIAMNPYAALCNQMLAEVITKLRTGEGEA